jgi:hypothetical protein
MCGFVPLGIIDPPYGYTSEPTIHLRTSFGNRWGFLFAISDVTQIFTHLGTVELLSSVEKIDIGM